MYPWLKLVQYGNTSKPVGYLMVIIIVIIMRGTKAESEAEFKPEPRE